MNDLSKLKRDSTDALMAREHGVCDACGAVSNFSFVPVITPRLAKQWRMTKAQHHSMSMRESMYCLFCGCSYRLRLLARAINYVAFGDSTRSLLERVDSGDTKRIKVAEINSCGVLHDILRQSPMLSYSEYVPSDPGVRHEDLEKLTYKADSFDIVLTSDVLEHVPDVPKALKETFRILRPGGVHVMSVPLLMDRKTKIRAKRMDDGSVRNVAAASHHGSGEDDYLVWSEFGNDFADMCRQAGFDAYYAFENTKNVDDISGIVIAVKPGKNPHLKTKLPGIDIFKLDTPNWSDRRLADLTNKMKLTMTHIHNLQSLLDANVEDNEKKQAYIQQLEARGLRYHIKRKINETGRRRGR